MIADNFKNINRRIRLAAERAGRNPADIRLVAVTKEHSVTVVAEGIRAGSKIFGENKVQGAKDKIKALGHDGIEWHFIGHLQKNTWSTFIALDAFPTGSSQYSRELFPNPVFH